MGPIIDRILSVALTVAAVVLVGVLVRRETRKPVAAGGPAATFDADWPKLVEAGHRMGRDGAPIVLIEFADFECPFCRRFSANLGPLKEEYGTSLAIVFVHFPLAGTHRFAIPAARAAECADEQGRFPELHDLLFEKQD